MLSAYDVLDLLYVWKVVSGHGPEFVACVYLVLVPLKIHRKEKLRRVKSVVTERSRFGMVWKSGERVPAQMSSP
ncbi:hypothetical protein TNCV_3231791 [Trichonephila clavipes]|nr:hypothetical protein TNCV_3231791 [Trichonephila clavipes]